MSFSLVRVPSEVLGMKIFISCALRREHCVFPSSGTKVLRKAQLLWELHAVWRLLNTAHYHRSQVPPTNNSLRMSWSLSIMCVFVWNPPHFNWDRGRFFSFFFCPFPARLLWRSVTSARNPVSDPISLFCLLCLFRNTFSAYLFLLHRHLCLCPIVGGFEERLLSWGSEVSLVGAGVWDWFIGVSLPHRFSCASDLLAMHKVFAPRSSSGFVFRFSRDFTDSISIIYFGWYLFWGYDFISHIYLPLGLCWLGFDPSFRDRKAKISFYLCSQFFCETTLCILLVPRPVTHHNLVASPPFGS